MNALFLQGLVFTALALGVFALLAWWLFFSPMKVSVAGGLRNDYVVADSGAMRYSLALLIGIGALLISFGAYWDVSEHIVTGIVPGGEDFLWPPHLMIYAGFLVAFVVAVGGLFALAVPNIREGVKDPRQWARRSPFIGAAAIVAGYGLFSIPGDAIWHELYGVDLTAWSPPHIFLTISAASLPVLAVGLLSRGGKHGEQDRRAKDRPPSRSRLQRFRASFDAGSFAKLSFSAVALALWLVIGSVEWEMEILSPLVAQRPAWLYPTVIGVSAFFFSVLVRKAVPGPWTATSFALLYFGVRLALSSFADAISGAPPRLTLVFVLGALLLDLSCRRMTRLGFRSADWQTRLAAAGAFAVGYAVVAQPTIALYLLQFLPWFSTSDHLFAALFTFLLCAALYPLADRLGSWLHSSEEEAPPTVPEIATAASADAQG